ncbi:hypothetical protein KFE25_011686 [Diacronema lutheri]|uniref:Uncharacterized protein n=1 Tax=Diacronema lutheri TaxID=2081491 RepID=A0A8J5X4J7_DIALT|nr:hypothetical protein KFE25_011662 [Diacronema lutheri]KAG8458155.1 hypothetical protein KFE25_011686 [Diacronema lutheri]
MFALAAPAASARRAAPPSKLEPPPVCEHVQWLRTGKDGRPAKDQIVQVAWGDAADWRVDERGRAIKLPRRTMAQRKAVQPAKDAEPWSTRIVVPIYRGIAWYAWKTGLIEVYPTVNAAGERDLIAVPAGLYKKPRLFGRPRVETRAAVLHASSLRVQSNLGTANEALRRATAAEAGYRARCRQNATARGAADPSVQARLVADDAWRGRLQRHLEACMYEKSALEQELRAVQGQIAAVPKDAIDAAIGAGRRLDDDKAARRFEAQRAALQKQIDATERERQAFLRDARQRGVVRAKAGDKRYEALVVEMGAERLRARDAQLLAQLEAGEADRRQVRAAVAAERRRVSDATAAAATAKRRALEAETARLEALWREGGSLDEARAVLQQSRQQRQLPTRSDEKLKAIKAAVERAERTAPPKQMRDECARIERAMRRVDAAWERAPRDTRGAAPSYPPELLSRARAVREQHATLMREQLAIFLDACARVDGAPNDARGR